MTIEELKIKINLKQTEIKFEKDSCRRQELEKQLKKLKLSSEILEIRKRIEQVEQTSKFC